MKWRQAECDGPRGAAWGADLDCGEGGLAEGLVSGTRIATGFGWRPVEAIAEGDLVMTFDHGLRPVTEVRRARLWFGPARSPRAQLPLAVPVGALGNSAALLLLPEQNVLVESDLAEEMFDDPFALIPAAALDGFRGIGREKPEGELEVVVLKFDTDEVIYANGTGLVHCSALDGTGFAQMLEDTAPYAVLPMAAACAVVAGLAREDAVFA